MEILTYTDVVPNSELLNWKNSPQSFQREFRRDYWQMLGGKGAKGFFYKKKMVRKLQFYNNPNNLHSKK